MAEYVDPPTLPPGAVPSSTDWNTFVVRNIQYLREINLRQDPPACRVRRSTNQSIATGGTGSVITFDAERFDTDTMWSSGSRITIVTAGLYTITGGALYAANSTGYRQTAIQLNGTTLLAADSKLAVTSPGATACSVAATYKMIVGDYVELLCFQNSGGALDVLTFQGMSPELSAVWSGVG